MTYTLTDKQFATVLDALQITRDLLRVQGLTGNDCQDALDALYRGITPATNGISYTLIQGEFT